MAETHDSAVMHAFFRCIHFWNALMFLQNHQMHTSHYSVPVRINENSLSKQNSHFLTVRTFEFLQEIFISIVFS
jgi:hypothetical protein